MGNLCTQNDQFTRESLASQYYSGTGTLRGPRGDRQGYLHNQSRGHGSINHMGDMNMRYGNQIYGQHGQGSRSSHLMNGSTNATLSQMQGGQNNILDQLNLDNVRTVNKIPYFNGDIYEGQVLNDKRDGWGVFYCANKEKRTNYEYEGQWRDNLREGQGKCYYYNEELYVGEWKAGKRHGEGELFTRKQDRYKGNWKNDLRHGKGTLISQNGSIFTGTWYQDKKHGRGEMTRQDK